MSARLLSAISMTSSRMTFSEGTGALDVQDRCPCRNPVSFVTMSPRANQTAADCPEFLAWQNARSRTLAAEGGLQTRLT